MSDFVFKKRNYAVILGILMLISACSEKSDDDSVNSSSSFNYAIDDKLHTEQVVIMLFDIHIGTDGRVLDVHFREYLHKQPSEKLNKRNLPCEKLMAWHNHIGNETSQYKLVPSHYWTINDAARSSSPIGH